jgi:uncharacterized protein (DUF1697 family)
VTTYIALLKGVNVGGNRMVPMADVRSALTEAGYGQVRTLLATGNIVLEAPKVAAATLESKLELDLHAALGVRTDVMVRDAREWAAIVAANPLPDVAASEPARLLVVVMKTPPDLAKARAYLETYGGPERVEFVGREAFVHYPDGQGASRLSIPKLGNGTARNWNTVMKLAALVG